MKTRKQDAAYYKQYNARNREKKREQHRKCLAKKRAAKGEKPAPRRYATRIVDYSQLIQVQVDRKTWVYAPKGSNPETVRAEYLSKNVKAA